MKKQANRKRITRDQWLSTGLKLIALSGVNGLKVELLARKLGVAKSGFYWHFTDRDTYLEELVEYWFHETTEIVANNPLVQEMPPRDRLLTVMTMVYNYDLSEFDLAMRAWSYTNPAIKARVRRAIKTRMDFVRQALADLGFEGSDLEMRVQLFVGFQSNERDMFGNSAKTVKLYREKRLELLLTRT
jgi:AcrR family transcriptional regulator